MSDIAVRSFIGAPALLPATVAAAAAASAALWVSVAQGVTICLVVSITLLPVWWGTLREYMFGRAVVIVGILAAGWGVALTLVDQYRDFSTSLLQGQTLNFLAFVGSIGMLLWSRSQIGLARTAMWFGVGSLVNIIDRGVDAENPWKFTFALPLAIAILGAASLAGRRWVEVMALVGLGTMSLLSDSRSMTAFFVLTIPVVAWQMIGVAERKESRPWQAILWLSALSFGAYNLFQSLLLDGVLGEAAQQRTALQIETSGSLILGGRPEAGAATALLLERPAGYGAGTLPSSTDIWIAKSGMNALGYDPDNGYVDRYMFGRQFEVHSTLGDLWIRFGPMGALLALLLIGVAVYAVAHSVSRQECSGVVVYLLLLGAWNTFFSPALPSFRTLALLFALTAIPVALKGDAAASRGATSPKRRSR